MEAMAIILPMVAGGIGAAGSIYEGNYENQAAKTESAQMLQKGDQEVALAQQEASAKRREATLANSRNLAVAAGSGAGASDPTVIQVMADVENQGVFNSLTEMYKGFSRRDDLIAGARARRTEGKNAQTAGWIKGVGTIFDGAAGSASNYLKMK